MLSLLDVVDARDSDEVKDGPGKPVIESSTLSSIGDDIDWKLLIRQLFDAIDSSPSVIEPNAESCDGLQLLLLLQVFVPRIEYSMRRLFEFFDVVHKSVVNWFENVDVDATDGMAKFSLVHSFDAFDALDAFDEPLAPPPPPPLPPMFSEVDGIDSFECMLLSKNAIGDEIDGWRNRWNWWNSDEDAVITTSSKTSSESLEMSNEFTSRNLNESASSAMHWNKEFSY